MGSTVGPDSTNRPSAVVVLAALLLYAALAAVGVLRNPDEINPDAVSYIHLADHLAHGRLALSVASHWSPLISWCIAPLLALGVDGLLAGRLVLVAWGARWWWPRPS